MFFFYYVWGFLIFILSYSHNFIENNFLTKNNPFLIRKRTFKYISYFEKLVLVLFYRKGWFENSIANLYRKKDILDYRKFFYPNVYSFHINCNKVSYEFDDLKFFVKQFNYYKKNKTFKKKLLKILNVCYKIKNRNFIKYLMLQYLYFNKYYNFNDYFHFYKKNNNNLIKLNRIFSIFLIKSQKKLIIFNLDKWYDWYNFNFNQNKKYLNLEIKLNKQQQKKIKDFKNNKIFKWINIVFKYKKRINNFNKFINSKFKGIIHFKFNLKTYFKILLNKDFSKLMSYYIVKFSESSITKHINSVSLKNYSFQFLRKNRIFNKGRYSRNRQLYRTGVYWCLWLNIIMVYGLYFIFYRFSFNFGYFWWGILFLAYSTIFSRIAKYNFYNINFLIKEFNNLIFWYGNLFNNLFKYLEINFFRVALNMNLFNNIAKYKNNSFSFFYDNYYFYFIKFFKTLINRRKKIKLNYFWQGMKERDVSFLRYKTFIHWIKEFYRLIIT